MGKVLSLHELMSERDSLRKENKKVVFTNGVFDIIHRGHIEYLIKAKALGDVLIVGLNSDSSVRRIKGDKRPIVGENDRSFVLANLSPVDYVCLFDEDTPLNLISAIVPDVLVKGADWSVDAIVGKDVVEKAGGRVMAIEFIPDRSTTSIIEMILKRFGSK
ncbi:MAG: D-glycero-beta-D-manno-heptose 1-phosphate adenylyltransferase [Ignavibacteriales bacterium]|nr:D-glycero-beta-D-manno-heptose 1-phosphate adenylyltransferase [Ignavibacteriales bacterium]